MASTDFTGEREPRKKRRLCNTDSDGDISSRETDIFNSSESTKEKLPHDIDRWTEEHIQSLSLVTKYEEETTPLQLINKFSLKFPLPSPLKTKNYFLANHINRIENILKQSYFHCYLDVEFQSLQINTSLDLRQRKLYETKMLLDSVNATEDMRLWFQRYEECGIQFGQILHNMVLKKDLVVKQGASGNSLDPLCDYDFQFLFQAFASMFGLCSHHWAEPVMFSSTMQLLNSEICGKADILYCLDVPNNVPGSLQELLHIVAVCEVQGHRFEGEQQRGDITTRSSESGVSSTSSGSLPPHIPLSLIGKHGGELLLYYQQSINKGGAIFGLIVQETKVTFTALQMTQQQYDEISAGILTSSKPTLIFTRSYDFMKREDRKLLIRPLLELAAMQELQISLSDKV